MALEETFCIDNFTLPKGPRGPRGPIGPIGLTGPGGIATKGPVGPPGGSKIDVNFQTSNKPFVELYNAGVETVLAHFIFPGTNTFTPKTWRIAIASFVRIGTNKLTLNLKMIAPNGTITTVATITKIITASSQGFVYEILEVSSFVALPATASNFFIDAIMVSKDLKASTRCYATELRE